MFGRRSVSSIPLASISTDYEVHAATTERLVMLLLGFTLGSLIVVKLLLAQPYLPHAIALYFVAFAVMAAVSAFRMMPRAEYYVFSNHWKRPLFSILREKEQAAECDAFLHAMINAIEGRKGSEDASMERVIVAAKPPGHSWKLAISSGVVGTCYPLIVYNRFVAGQVLVLPVAVLACRGGLVAALYAFLNRERRRWWSLLGVALCLVPVLFY